MPDALNTDAGLLFVTRLRMWVIRGGSLESCLHLEFYAVTATDMNNAVRGPTKVTSFELKQYSTALEDPVMSEIRAGDTGGPGEQSLIWYLASLCKETFVDDKKTVSLFDTAILSRSPLLAIMCELLQHMPVQLLFKYDERRTRLQGATAVTATRVGAFMKKQMKQLLLAVFECCYRGLLGNPKVHSLTQAAVHLYHLKLAGQRGPICVMGEPTSGTCLMQLLLSMDETARSPQRWEYITPSSFFERKKRVVRARNIQRGFKKSARDGFLARVEEARPTFPAKDIDLFHFMRADEEFPGLTAARSAECARNIS